MKVIDDISSFEKNSYSVVTIGTFDGVHRGHQAILELVVQEAKRNHGKSSLITFWPHPRFILKPEDDTLKLLSTFEEKIDLISQIGIDYLIKLTFTKAFSNQSADEFVRTVLIDGIGTKKLFIGYDHHFGNNREGNITFLKERSAFYGFEVQEIPRQDIDDIGVSSTKVRKALSNGEIPLATALLGRPYSITGHVVQGARKGRSIGFPTANIELPASFKLLPGDGVYAVSAMVEDRQLKGMLNIGFRPTVGGKRKSIECHLFNFEEDIYGKKMVIQFVDFIRSEKKFDSLEDLKNQLEKDKIHALSLLK